MARRGENIYKRRDGRWEGRYIKYRTSTNKAIYGYVYSKTYSEVKERLLYLKTHNNDSADNKQNKENTFGNIANLWLMNKSNSSKPSTVNRYTNLLNNHILPCIGEKPISNITTILIQEQIKYLSENGRMDDKGGLSSKTISDIICIIKSILYYGESIGYNHKCSLRYISYKAEKREMRVLSRCEQKILTAYLTEEPDFTKAGILLALYTGIRIGELCALKTSCIDLEKGSMHIGYTLQRLQTFDSNGEKTCISISTPKSLSAIRDIPLPEFICKVYANMCLSQTDYILSGKSVPIEPRTLENRYNKIMKHLQIENATFHTLRHTFATRSIEVGFDVKSLSEVLGHSSVKITLDRYVHSSFELKAENMMKLATLL